MSELISVVIPAYQAATTITETLASVTAQTYPRIEVVVVDDGSTDGTGSRVEAFPDVRYIRQPNAGDAAARNAGIGAANGDLIAFLDADDLWRADKLERQLGSLRADPTAGGVQCGALYVDELLRPLEVRVGHAGRMRLMDVLMFGGMPAFSSAVLVRRSCLDRIGLIDISVRGKDEWDFAIRIARSCGLTSLSEPLVIRRVHAASASRQAAYAGRQVRPGLEILRRLFDDPSLSYEVRRRRRRAHAAFYRMLAGSYAQARAWPKAIGWALRAGMTHPAELAAVARGALRRSSAILGDRTSD